VAALGNWLRASEFESRTRLQASASRFANGQFDYLARWRLTATRLRFPIAAGEIHKGGGSRLGDRMPFVQLTAQRDSL